MTAPLRADHDRDRRRRRARLGPLLDAATSTSRPRSARSAPTARRRSCRAAGCAPTSASSTAARARTLEPVLSLRKRDVKPLPRKRFVKVTIPLYYQGHAYRAGSRIRVTLSAPNGDQPIWAFAETSPAKRAKIEIARSKKKASNLLLPVVAVPVSDRPAAVPRPPRRAVPRLPALQEPRGEEEALAVRSAPVDGFRLAYERAGSGPPVVLLHGWPGDRTDYEAVVPLLAPDFEVVVPDLRGFGASDKHLEPPAEAYSAAAQAVEDRARRAGAGARARGLAALSLTFADRGGARRRPRGGARVPRALLAPLVGPRLRARRRAPRPPRRRLRRAGGDDRLDRLVPRGLRDGRLLAGRDRAGARASDRHADHDLVAGARPALPARVVGPARRLLQRRRAGRSSTAPGTSRPSRRPRRSPPRSARARRRSRAARRARCRRGPSAPPSPPGARAR